MADTTIPVLLRVQAERDPELRAILEGIEQDLAAAAKAAQRAGGAMAGMDSGKLDAAAEAARDLAAAVRGVDQRADATRAGLDKVGEAGKASLAEVATGADKAEDALQKAERASAQLLAGLQRVSMQTAGAAAMGSTPGAAGVLLSRKVLNERPEKPVDVAPLERYSRALEQIEDRYDTTARRAVEFGQTAGMSMMAAGAGLAALSGYAVQAAGEFEQLRAKLETVQKSASKAQQTFEFARELAAKTPFDVKGVVAAAVQLEVYGTRAQEVLPLVADLAAGMGKDIEATSLVIGKAMSGSLEGFESLRNEFGVSSAKLARFGAVLTATGGISVATAADMDKARTALQAVIRSEFGGAVERQSRTFQGAMSNAGDSAQNLAAAWGEELIPLVTLGARAFSGVVDTLASIPGPLRTVGALAAAGGAAILTMGGAAVMATTALAAMNVQLQSAAALGLPGVAAASRVTAGALGTMATVARGVGASFAWLFTTPIGLAVAGIGVAFGGAMSAINSYEERQRLLGERLVEESRNLQRTTQDWRTYTEVVRRAKGGEVEGAPSGADAAARFAAGLQATTPQAVVASARGAGLDQAAMERAVREQETLRAAVERQMKEAAADMDAARAAWNWTELDQARSRLEALSVTLQNTIRNREAAQQLLEVFRGFEGPLSKAVAESAKLDGYLKFAVRARDLASLNQALAETANTLSALQAAAAGQGLPAYDATSLQRRLLDAIPGTPEAEAIERILTLMGEQEQIQERINQVQKDATDERIRLMDQEFARAQAGRDEDLQATLAYLRAKLQAVQGNVAEETASLNAIRDVEKRIREQRLADQKNALQRAYDAAVQAAENTADAEGATAPQVAEAYQSVVIMLDAWADKHRQLLSQVPELQQQYDSLRRGAEDKADRTAEASTQDKLGRLRQQTQDLQRDARGPEEQVSAIRQSIELYERVLRTDQQIRDSQKARESVQQSITDLRRQEAALAEQIADRERQTALQVEGVRQQALDQEIATLEARKAAGENVEADLAEKRLQRYQMAIDLIEMEMQAEVDSAGKTEDEKEAAREKARLRRRMLDEQERQRILRGITSEAKATEDAEGRKRAARNYDPAQRIGGSKSPIMGMDEAFSYGFGLGDFSLGTGLRLGDKSAAAGKKSSAASVDALGAAASDTSKKVQDLAPPVQDLAGKTTTLGGSFVTLAGAAGKAASALEGLGSGTGTGGGEDKPPAPEGTTNDGNFSYAPGAGPADAKPGAVGDAPPAAPPSGYPGTGDYPGAPKRTLPTPAQMGALSPRVLAPTGTTNSTRNEVSSVVNIDGLRAARTPEVDEVARAVNKLAAAQASRNRVYRGPWA